MLARDAAARLQDFGALEGSLCYDVGSRVVKDFNRAFHKKLVMIYSIKCEVGSKGSFRDLL